MSDYKEFGQKCYGWADGPVCGCPRCEPPEHKFRKMASFKRFLKRTMARNRRRSKEWMKNYDTDT